MRYWLLGLSEFGKLYIAYRTSFIRQRVIDESATDLSTDLTRSTFLRVLGMFKK